jgi:ribosomal protein L34
LLYLNGTNQFGISADDAFRMQQMYKPQIQRRQPGHGLQSRSKCRCSLRSEIVAPEWHKRVLASVPMYVFACRNIHQPQMQRRQPGHGLQSRSKCRCSLAAEIVVPE